MMVRFNVFQIGQIAGVGELVEVHDVVIRIFVDEEAHDVRADESGTADDEYITLHLLTLNYADYP